MQITTFKRYWGLIKPGIVFGNMIPVLGGFLLAEPSWKDWPTLLWVMLATFCLVGSACVFNNYYERDIDGLMTRTQNRVLVHVMAFPKYRRVWHRFGIVCQRLGDFGPHQLGDFCLGHFWLCGVCVDLHLIVARHSIHQTTLGSFSGACPPVRWGIAALPAFSTLMRS